MCFLTIYSSFPGKGNQIFYRVGIENRANLYSTLWDVPNGVGEVERSVGRVIGEEVCEI